MSRVIAAILISPLFTINAASAKMDDAAIAYDDERGIITVTATRTEVSVEEAPATVSVIDEQQIADELATDIKDLVRFEPGVSVPRAPARFGAALGSTGRAGNEGFTIRGIGGNRVLIQVDGVRVPDGFSFGAQASGRGDYVDLGLVKSVEILRGPASALYGSDGLSGAVSFITSDPDDFLTDNQKIGGIIRSAYNSADNEFSETAIIAGKKGNISALFSYTRRDFNELENQGDIDIVGSGRTKANPQNGKSNAALGKLVWQPSAGHSIKITGEYSDTKLNTNILSGLGSSGFGTTIVDALKAEDSGSRKRISAGWIFDNPNDGLIDYVNIAAYWQKGKDLQFTDEDRSPLADRERLNSFDNRVFGASVEMRSDFATGPLQHRFILGGDISQTEQKGLRDGVTPPFGEVFPTRAFPVTNFTLAGIFVGDEIAIGDDRLTLFPALRFDYYNLNPENDPLLPLFTGAKQDGSRLSPKFGAVLKLNEIVRIFGNYAQGFKSPSPSQVNNFFENLAFGYTSLSNPNLKPESSESFEAGLRLNNEFIGLSATIFHANYDNFISQEVVGGAFTPSNPAIYQFVNLDKVRVRGAEARLQLNAQNGLNGNIALSYAKGDVHGRTNSAPDTPLSTIDPLKLVMGVGYRAPSGNFGGQLTMTHSAQKEENRTTGLCTPSCFRPDAFTIVDATAFLRIADSLTLRAGIFNILDKKYAWWSDVRGLASTSTITDAYTQPGRNASISASFRF
ncbi:TonB-dependent receptor [Sphingorhabdus lutea]|uniref:TonB-dependent receptor n=1 Tax=Sphingorhabdus lutea TaxID=1913578 RepID=A0A1L3JEJ8_9SPHN|nr:TonB-dependent receptor [Sphingorhabdus lutea]